MKEIKVGIKIGKHEMVGVIFEADGVYYSIYGLGKIPKYGGNWVRGFKGDEVQLKVEKMVEDLNKGSIAYQRKREELKKEILSPLKRDRTMLMSERERRKIKRMASDKGIFDPFS